MADSPHDIGLQVLAAGGVPLLVCLVVLVVLTVRRAAQVLPEHPEAWGPALAAGAYGLAMLANFTAAGPTCFAAFLVGAVVAVPPAVEREATWARAARTGLFGVASLVFLMSCVAETMLGNAVDAAAAGDVATATDELEKAQRWRPLDSDIDMLGAQALAAAASTGDVDAARAAEELARSSLRRTPDSYASRVALGVALLTQDQPEAAERELDGGGRARPRAPGRLSPARRHPAGPGRPRGGGGGRQAGPRDRARVPGRPTRPDPEPRRLTRPPRRPLLSCSWPVRG